MKKVLWWILGILLSPILLFVILTLLLYYPPVQNWAVDKVAAIASEKTGMHITVGNVCLAFPLDLEINEVKVIEQDTIADVGRLIVDVQLKPLIDKRVVINQLEIRNTKINTGNFVEAAHVKGSIGRLFVSSKGIDLDKETVELNGNCLEEAMLDVVLNDSVPQDTTKTENHWKIHADELTISKSALSLRLNDTTQVKTRMGEIIVQELMADLGTPAYSVGSVSWTDGALNYGNMGFDPFELHVSRVTVTNDSIKVPWMELKTPNSSVAIHVAFPMSFTDSVSPGSLQFGMDAKLGKQDILPFLKDMPQAFQQQWPEGPLALRGQVEGNMRHMEFYNLLIDLPTAFNATATGWADNLDTPDKLQADVQFKAETQNLGFAMAMMPRDMQRSYRLPPMSAEGRVKTTGEEYEADITAREGGGMLKAKGLFNARAESYSANLKIQNLNVRHFMPRDSIYTISAEMDAKGHGFDFLSPRTTLNADAKIYHVGYKLWNLDNLSAQATVKNGHALVDLNSNNNLLKGRIGLDALMNKQKFIATLTTDLHTIDLYEMQLVENPLSLMLCGQFDITSDLKKSHSVTGLVGDILVRDSVKTVRSEFIGLHLKTDPDTTVVRLQSGDFIVKLDGSGGYERLGQQFAQLSDTLMAQIEKKVIDQPALRRQLPTMKLHIESKKENPLSAMMKSQGMEFKEMFFDMNTSVETGINGNGHIHSLVVSDVRLDTINFRLTQRKEKLSFGGQIRNNKKNPQFVFNALFDGILQERGATMGVRYFDADNRMGARIGLQGEMIDGGLRIHLIPERPTLGYKIFNLDRSNYIFFPTDGKVRAHIDLRSDDGMGVKIFSSDRDTTALQDLTVSVNKFNLEELTSVLPYAPRMTGMLNGDIHVLQDAHGNFNVLSDVDVRNMTYEKCPLGNIGTELVYMQKEDSTHAVEARLLLDDTQIGLLRGIYYHKGEGSLDAKMSLERLPLSIANGFMTDQVVGLQGYADGVLSVKGSMTKPVVNGEMLLSQSYMESVPYGVKFSFDDDVVRIVNSNLILENFTIYGLNKNPLTIQGNVDFSNTEKIKINMSMRARNFQMIGAKETPKSVAYGKAFIDLYARMQGTMDNLYMRGRLNILGTTDVGYILRDTPLTTDNQMDALVKFADFSDSTKTVVERPSLTGFRMDMTVDVSKGVHVMAYLNSDHSNYIDLMGGGTLRMQYNPADNLQLTGRYTLSNGEMKYALPIIPLKTFTIQDGSYVEFIGDVMNPTLNITATERVKSSVPGSNGVSRTVDFDCGVMITKKLSDMGLQFTLDAPEDMQLHSELQAMSIEERGKLAVTMLTTGLYLSDGNTGTFSMNSALSSFLSSEISSLTGSALRTLDLSFGMDNNTDASGQQYTDYSFKFAKRFLNNRLKLMIGGKVTSGNDLPGGRNKSFFDNVELEYRLDNTANKYLNFFFENNSYDWLDGYTQKYGGGFIWRRSLQKITDIFRKEKRPMMRRPMTTTNPAGPASPTSFPSSTSPANPVTPTDSLKTPAHETK